jgi:hypothetical protein
VKPLSELRNLTELGLLMNQISEKGCPVKPESICRL